MDQLSHSSIRLDGLTTLFDDFAQPFPLPESCTNRVVDSLSNHFTAVLSQMVFHVLTKEQSENITKRMHSMLKKGGVLLGCCMASKEEATSWAKTPKGDGFRFLHSIKTLTELLTEVGFVDVEVREIKSNPEMAAKYKNSACVPHMPEGQAEVKKCRLEFVGIKK